MVRAGPLGWFLSLRAQAPAPPLEARADCPAWWGAGREPAPAVVTPRAQARPVWPSALPLVRSWTGGGAPWDLGSQQEGCGMLRSRRSAACIAPAPGLPVRSQSHCFPDTVPIAPLLGTPPQSPAILRAHQARAGSSCLRVGGGDDRAWGQGRPGGPVLKASYGVVPASPLSSFRTFPSDKDASYPFAVTPPSPWQPPVCSLSRWICLSWAFPCK